MKTTTFVILAKLSDFGANAQNFHNGDSYINLNTFEVFDVLHTFLAK